ncbi:ATP synthase F0 subunit B [Candidatus Nomurabacteria bacterium]|nr:ATP synthase F0 subunit B [Candidatus Nomurabacteria bacterium]
MDSIISTFHIDWKIIIAQAVNFGIVFAVLYIFALKPLNKLMAERTEKIKKGIDDAKKSEEMLLKAAHEYEENTIKLRKLSIDTQKELKKDLEKLRAENIERIKKDEAEHIKKRAVQMEIDKKTLVESAKNEIASLATLIAKKIMEGEKK